MDFAGPEMNEGQLGHVLPDLESFGQLPVHVGSLQSRRVFRNAVRQLFDTPATPCVQMQNRRLNNIQIPRKPLNKCALSPAAPFLYTHTHTQSSNQNKKEKNKRNPTDIFLKRVRLTQSSRFYTHRLNICIENQRAFE